MSPSIKRRLVVAAGAVLALVLVASLLRDDARPREPHQSARPIVALQKEPRNRGTRVPITATSERPLPGRSNPRESTTTRRRQAPPLEGYLVDDFRSWSSLPPGYYAEGLQVQAGALRVPPRDLSTSVPGTAMLESPPLPLRQPSLQAPAENRTPLPEGTEIQLQLRLSSDGRTWTPWAMADQYRRPDGTLAMPEPVPALMPGTIPPPDDEIATPTTVAEGETLTRPLVRYRLSITSRAEQELVVRDVRLWKRHR